MRDSSSNGLPKDVVSISTQKLPLAISGTNYTPTDIPEQYKPKHTQSSSLSL